MSKLSLFFITILCFFSATVSHAETVLQDTRGERIPFSSLKGKWVFINYWASWCGPCVDEIPELNRFYDSHKKDMALFAVNYDALPLNEQKSLIRKLRIHYPLLAQDPAKSLNLGDIRGVPVTFVFNPQGKLVTTLYGAQTIKDLNKVLTS